MAAFGLRLRWCCDSVLCVPYGCRWRYRWRAGSSGGEYVAKSVNISSQEASAAVYWAIGTMWAMIAAATKILSLFALDPRGRRVCIHSWVCWGCMSRCPSLVKSIKCNEKLKILNSQIWLWCRLGYHPGVAKIMERCCKVPAGSTLKTIPNHLENQRIENKNFQFLWFFRFSRFNFLIY